MHLLTIPLNASVKSTKLHQFAKSIDRLSLLRTSHNQLIIVILSVDRSTFVIYEISSMQTLRNSTPIFFIFLAATFANAVESDSRCDNLDSLELGPLTLQTGESGMIFSAFPVDHDLIDVVNSDGDIELRHLNTSAPDTASTYLFVSVESAGIAARLDNGVVFSFDYRIENLNTNRYYSLRDQVTFTTICFLGDDDNDGFWNVLINGEDGFAESFDTQAAIPLVATVKFAISDTSLIIEVNGEQIYSGQVSSWPATPERLSFVSFGSRNEFGSGAPSPQLLDNFALNSDSCRDGSSCQFGLGDVNNDGAIDLEDVHPFVVALVNDQFVCEADVNQDGCLDLLDVSPFVALLSGG